jgi:hypothetical protein
MIFSELTDETVEFGDRSVISPQLWELSTLNNAARHHIRDRGGR